MENVAASTPSSPSPSTSSSSSNAPGSTGNSSPGLSGHSAMRSTPAPAQGAKASSLPSSPPPGGGDPSPTPTTPTPPQAAEYFDIKVNGKMQRMSRQEVMDHASMTAAAQQKFEEAAKIRRDFERTKELAKKDFFQLLQDPSLGLTKDQIREKFEDWYHREYIEPEQLSPDQKKLREAQSRIKQFEESEAERKRQSDEEHLTRLTNQQRELIESEIIDAFESSGLPKNKFLMARMAFYMLQNGKNGWQAPKEMLIKQVKNERQQIFSDLTAGSSVEQVVEMLGDEFMNRLRKFDLEELRKRRQMPNFQNPEVPIARSGQPEKVYGTTVAQRLRDIRTGKLSF